MPREWNLLGNKSQLRAFLWDEVLAPLLHPGDTVADLFCGSSSVSRLLAERGHTVVACDAMYWCHVVNKAYMASPDDLVDLPGLVARLNLHAKTHHPSRPPGFVERTYSSLGGRLYFMRDNARRIDLYRAGIEALRPGIPEGAYCALLACLLHAVGLHSNCTGHLRAYLKTIKASAEAPLVLDVGRLGPLGLGTKHAGTKHTSLFGDARALAVLAAETCDVVYCDPPYTNRSYARFYHLYETVARGDAPEVYGVAGLRCDAPEDPFSKKTTCRQAFVDLVRAIVEAPGRRARWLVVSYSTDGLLDETQLCEVLSQHTAAVTVKRTPHKRYNRPNTSVGVSRRVVYELAFVCAIE